ncbi:MAG: DUF881 domain-containing protein [Chloroflexota bacterium]|nr:DUF881 domain-containing protein [Chloroflexota bacterium]MDE3192904.1 DUF881 domain-containing protein [Chloroflexota bacterium]
MRSVALQKGLAIAVPALVFGFLVAAQWATLAAPGSRDVGIRYIDPLTASLGRLQDEQTSLKAQLADVRAKLDQLQRAGAAQNGTVRDLSAQLDDLKRRAGLTDASGEGVVVTLDATRAAADLTQDRLPCFAPDLTDIVNAAWRGGARAVAIDGERIVASSSVYCVGGTIVVNGSIVSAPFTVTAVGPTSSILAVVDDPSQLSDLKRRRDQQVVDLRIASVPAVTLPAYGGPVVVRSATPQ